MPTKPLDARDLDHILDHTPFAQLRDARIFITGGTGFFGHWLLESLLHANHDLHLNAHATVLTRSAARFRQNSPHIANSPAITLLEGDIKTFPFPPGPYTHILHAATDSTGAQSHQTAEELHDSILTGTRHVLRFASGQPTAPRFLYVSTGAVYGRSTTLPNTPETFPTPDLPLHSYEAAKLAAENRCLGTLPTVIARCFAFVGPHLPLDGHFAIGNFIGSALTDQPIHIKGDGTPRRSWLYMADLAIWLWTLLLEGHPNRAYNVGSPEGMTIAEAAHLTATTLNPTVPVQIDGTPNPTAPLNSYVPDVNRALNELGLRVTSDLPEALRRTAAWYR